MKQVYKNYMFSNFKNAFFDDVLEKNQLLPNESYNVILDNKSIKSTNGFIDYFYKKINNIAANYNHQQQ